MQLELAINEAELLRRDELSMGNAHPLEWPIEIGGPEI